MATLCMSAEAIMSFLFLLQAVAQASIQQFNEIEKLFWQDAWAQTARLQKADSTLAVPVYSVVYEC